MLLIVTGCGSGSLNNLDINKASVAVEKALDDMVNIEGETLEDVYGVSLSTIEEFVVKQGDRIAQMVISKIEQVEFDIVKELNETKRGNSGFGHTGIN
jgi:hypothetical protein